MKLSTKLLGGFGTVVIITILVGLVGWIATSKLGKAIHVLKSETIPAVSYIDDLESSLKSLRIATRTLMSPLLSEEDRERQFKNIEEAKKEIAKTVKSFEAIPNKPPQVIELWNQLIPKLNEYLSGVEIFLNKAKEIKSTGITNPMTLASEVTYFQMLHYSTMVKVSDLIQFNEDFQGGEDASQCEFGKWLASFRTENEELKKHLAEIDEHHKNFHQGIEKIKKAVKDGDIARATMVYRMELKPQARQVFDHFHEIRGLISKGEALYREMLRYGMEDLVAKQRIVVEMLEKATKIIDDKQNADIRLSESSQRLSRIMILSGVLLGVIFAILIGGYIAISTTRSIRRIASGLYEGSEQITLAATQVASSSQVLAEMTSQQAAAVEETSSALEEMASMTRQNASNVVEADRLMKETKEIVSEANISMEDLAQSMEKINQASGETFKIIKTIDEIAFQTNLLALNAAVEAARAGEAGAGFAVVADEVRSLAIRAAEAAKNTASLIETTITKVREGTAIAERTRETFLRVAQSSDRVSELLGEIAVSSEEQKQGIEQVNRAIAETDKAIQKNAANAEESASAAEELSAQANDLKSFAKELLALVGKAEIDRGAPMKKATEPKALPATLSPKMAETKKALSTIKPFVQAKTPSSGVSKKVFIKPIMVWSKEYEVGVSEIDEQHQRLFKMVNDLNEAMARGQGKDVLDQILTGLVDYAARHFQTEEMYMRKANYPELDSHREIHERLANRVHEMVDRYKMGEVGLVIELLNFLQDWLKKHILGTDKRYGQYLSGMDLRSMF
ncbi:MAG: bacteriohemerythrin [Syntrophobacterales bacterium]|nr:bacteriohemerythrin [Syntrophobacterales bacterium]